MREPKRRKPFRPHQPRIETGPTLSNTAEMTPTDQALDVVAFRDRLVQGVRRMRRAGLVDVFTGEE